MKHAKQYIENGVCEQVARQEIAQANSETVKAKQDLHAFQIEQMRLVEEMRHADKKKPPSPDPAASRKVAETDDVQGIISGLESQKIGELSKSTMVLTLDLTSYEETGRW